MPCSSFLTRPTGNDSVFFIDSTESSVQVGPATSATVTATVRRGWRTEERERERWEGGEGNSPRAKKYEKRGKRSEKRNGKLAFPSLQMVRLGRPSSGHRTPRSAVDAADVLAQFRTEPAERKWPRRTHKSGRGRTRRMKGQTRPRIG